LAVLVAQWVQGRRKVDPPTQPQRHIPIQIDRADFADQDQPWAVLVFTSEMCTVCASVAEKARVLASEQVTVQKISFEDRVDLHRRYQIDSVPTLVITDAQGEVRYGIVGPVSATDLWAAMARVRDPDLDISGGCSH
jgi:thioredoxin-related protein